MIKIVRWFFLGLYTVITIIPKYLITGIICIIDPKKGAVLKYKGKPVIPIVMMGLTLSVYFICIFWASRWYVQRLKINYLTQDILASTKVLENEKKENIDKIEYIPSGDNEYNNIGYISVDFSDLIAKNNERLIIRMLIIQ